MNSGASDATLGAAMRRASAQPHAAEAARLHRPQQTHPQLSLPVAAAGASNGGEDAAAVAAVSAAAAAVSESRIAFCRPLLRKLPAAIISLAHLCGCELHVQRRAFNARQRARGDRFCGPLLRSPRREVRRAANIVCAGSTSRGAGAFFGDALAGQRCARRGNRRRNFVLYVLAVTRSHRRRCRRRQHWQPRACRDQRDDGRRVAVEAARRRCLPRVAAPPILRRREQPVGMRLAQRLRRTASPAEAAAVDRAPVPAPG